MRLQSSMRSVSLEESFRGSRARLRVALLLDCGPLSWGTREEFFARLCGRICDCGGTAVIIFSGDVAAPIQEQFRARGIEFRVAALERGLNNYFYILRDIIINYNINIVNIRFFVWSSPIPWIARFLGLERILFTESTGGMWEKKWWKVPLIRMRSRVTCWPVTHFIAISEFVKCRMNEVGLNPAKMTVVYNGVDLGRYKPDPGVRDRWRAEYKLDPREILISTASVLLPIKDVATILRAFAEVKRRGILARLFIAGDGPLKSELENLATSLGLGGWVHWLGYLGDPTPLFQSSDIFMLATRGEAFGNVLAEAMACGVPIVGSRCGATGEIVADGVTGLLASPGQPGEFADAVESLVRDPSRRLVMGRLGIERVHRMFGIDAAVEGTLRVYETAVNGSRNPGAGQDSDDRPSRRLALPQRGGGLG